MSNPYKNPKLRQAAWEEVRRRENNFDEAPPKPIDPKELEMYMALCHDKITEDDWIRYKQPRTNKQVQDVAKLIEAARMIKKWRKTLADMERLAKWN